LDIFLPLSVSLNFGSTGKDNPMILGLHYLNKK
jgi:hypothetical protein